MAKALIVDDDPMMGKVLLKMLDKMGHAAECTQSLTAGREKLAQDEYDVVLLDVNLPDGSGLDLLPEISKDPRGPEVIIITGRGDPDGGAEGGRSLGRGQGQSAGHRQAAGRPEDAAAAVGLQPAHHAGAERRRHPRVRRRQH